ncbi:MAG: FAD-dependent oxidoreductase [Niabella sp.]
MSYDIIIIGSGLGGLLCGCILSQQGKRVLVMEKNKQLGGNLQTFSRDKHILDTGVHYIGGLDKGQNLYQIFKYTGIIEKLRLQRMDVAFDRVLIENDEQEYLLSQGYDLFKENLAAQFPSEVVGIEEYCHAVREVCKNFPLYNLTLEGDTDAKLAFMQQSAEAVIASFVQDEKLWAVLAGNNLLYAGDAATTPFHVHALIANSYIESSWKVIDGGSQIAKLLAAQIRKHGGDIMRNCEVSKIVEENGRVSHVETLSGKAFAAEVVISNASPVATIAMTQSGLLKEVYRKRINSLANSISSFSLHLILKEQTIPYQSCNYYYHRQGKVWLQNHYTEADWPLGYGLYFTADRKHPEYASTISVLTPMRFADVAAWADTFNRAGREGTRGAGYEQFKQEKAQKLLSVVSEKFPHLTENIKAVYTSTPLTNRDYIDGVDGSMYGVQKDFHDPFKTMISPRTKIPNLFLTGQNLNLHGILGTSLSAVFTCSVALGDDSLVDKIRNA